ncbi:hypothetical protein [Clostridium sp.]
MKQKSCFNGITKCIFLLLIVGHAFGTKPKLVNNNNLNVYDVKENTPIPNDDKKEMAILDLFQSRYIISIFLAGLIIPIVIVIVCCAGLFSYSDIINIVNLSLKSLSLMVTIFLPVALIDSIRFSRKYKNGNSNIKFLKNEIIFQQLAFYSLIIFGNIRSWLNEFYCKTEYYTPGFLIKVDKIEIISLVSLVVFLMISIFLEICQWHENKVKK